MFEVRTSNFKSINLICSRIHKPIRAIRAERNSNRSSVWVSAIDGKMSTIERSSSSDWWYYDGVTNFERKFLGRPSESVSMLISDQVTLIEFSESDSLWKSVFFDDTLLLSKTLFFQSLKDFEVIFSEIFSHKVEIVISSLGLFERRPLRGLFRMV